MLSRWVYYLRSIYTILRGMKNPGQILSLFLGLPVDQPLIVELKDGSRYRVRSAMDTWVLKETCLDQDYERNGAPIQDGWTVIDIGAGLGDFAVSVGLSHPDCRVYAFEPFSESYELMVENIRLNQVANVFPFPYAVSAESGVRNLLTTTGVAVQHSTARGPETAELSEFQQVDCIGLEWTFNEHSLPHCDYLKVDCEGGEYEIFFQMEAATLGKIARICLEYHDGVTAYSHVDLIAFFEKHGYQVKTFSNPVHRNLGFLYAANPDLTG